MNLKTHECDGVPSGPEQGRNKRRVYGQERDAASPPLQSTHYRITLSLSYNFQTPHISSLWLYHISAIIYFNTRLRRRPAQLSCSSKGFIANGLGTVIQKRLQDMKSINHSLSAATSDRSVASTSYIFRFVNRQCRNKKQPWREMNPSSSSPCTSKP